MHNISGQFTDTAVYSHFVSFPFCLHPLCLLCHFIYCAFSSTPISSTHTDFYWKIYLKIKTFFTIYYTCTLFKIKSRCRSCIKVVHVPRETSLIIEGRKKHYKIVFCICSAIKDMNIKKSDNHTVVLWADCPRAKIKITFVSPYLTGNKTTHRQDNSPTRILRQFTDRF